MNRCVDPVLVIDARVVAAAEHRSVGAFSIAQHSVAVAYAVDPYINSLVGVFWRSKPWRDEEVGMTRRNIARNVYLPATRHCRDDGDFDVLV